MERRALYVEDNFHVTHRSHVSHVSVAVPGAPSRRAGALPPPGGGAPGAPDRPGLQGLPRAAHGTAKGERGEVGLNRSAPKQLHKCPPPLPPIFILLDLRAVREERDALHPRGWRQDDQHDRQDGGEGRMVSRFESLALSTYLQQCSLPIQ